MKKVVAVGMSGGVDSSVSALLLQQAGFEVLGLFMKNWEESDSEGQCLASKDQEDAAKVCQQLGIPLYTLNFTEEYYEEVFEDLLEGLKKGLTPNPDILCNKEIKFKLFLKKAISLGADYLATGHYAQIQKNQDLYLLHKGVDPGKDQSYFIYTLQQSQLEKVLFPIGHLKKQEVREIAKKYQLATSEKKDSTGICFIGKRNFQQFISQYLKQEKGPLVTPEGKVVGEHYGSSYYTIGQRKGLGIGGEGDAWFVVDKDIPSNKVIVAQGESHPLLFSNQLTACNLSWVNSPPSTSFSCTAKIRYRQQDQPCQVTLIQPDLYKVEFLTPQRAVTPGQSIVFYQEMNCLGGGIIKDRS